MADKDSPSTIETSEFCCGSCQGNTWKLEAFTTGDGRTFLTVVCATKSCSEIDLSGYESDEEPKMIWKIFDITGQLDNDLHITSLDELHWEHYTEDDKKILN